MIGTFRSRKGSDNPERSVRPTFRMIGLVTTKDPAPGARSLGREHQADQISASFFTDTSGSETTTVFCSGRTPNFSVRARKSSRLTPPAGSWVATSCRTTPFSTCSCQRPT